MRNLFRAAGSAGARFPLELYVAVPAPAASEGLLAGVHWYDPVEHALVTMGPVPSGDAAAVVVTGIPWRTGWRYRERGFRHIYWDAGTMLSQLLAVADSGGLSGRPAPRLPRRRRQRAGRGRRVRGVSRGGGGSCTRDSRVGGIRPGHVRRAGRRRPHLPAGHRGPSRRSATATRATPWRVAPPPTWRRPARVPRRAPESRSTRSCSSAGRSGGSTRGGRCLVRAWSMP